MSIADVPEGGGRDPAPRTPADGDVEQPFGVDQSFEVDEPFNVDGLHGLRSTVAAHASGIGLADSDIEALIIIAGELATNAIRHGGGGGRLRLWHDERHVCLQISDDGPGIADLSIGTVQPEPHSSGGRGVWIVRSLSVDVVIDQGPTGRGARVTALIQRVDPSDAADSDGLDLRHHESRPH